MALYDNGASFETVDSKGKLYVKDRGMVDNLNAEMLDGTHKSDFLKQGTVDSVNYGIQQTGKTLSATGVSLVFDETSQFKLGNIVIKPSNGGRGVLIGFENGSNNWIS